MEKDTTLKEVLQESSGPDQALVCQFKTIADTLLAIEYYVPWIGIPYLPKTIPREKTSKDFFYPENDYLKASLITVQSPIIIEAIEVIKNKKSEQLEANILLNSLRNLSLFDKITFPLISGIVVFILCYSSLAPFSLDPNRRIIASLVSGIGSLVTASFFYLEEIRFFFFTKLLDEEILRRSGKLTDSKFPEINVKAYSRVKNP